MTRKTTLPPETAGAATDARRAVRGGGGAGAPAGTLQMPPRIVRGARLRRYWMALALWGACVLYFWVWWLSPAHILSPVRYWLLTLLLFWITFLQAYFLYFALNARRVTSTLSDLGPFRAAMVVTKTPVEPFSVLRPTLEAMLAQSVPHDTWLADEDPDQETRDWCQQNGVRISSRKGVESYHRSEWPRRTRCKEGNLATSTINTAMRPMILWRSWMPITSRRLDTLRPCWSRLRILGLAMSQPPVSVQKTPAEAGLPARGCIQKRCFMARCRRGILPAGHRCASGPIMRCAPKP